MAPNTSRVRLVLTTLDAETDAAPLARALVEEGLAACVSVLPPMVSVFRWQGGVERAREQQLVIKTTAERVDALTARVSALHPYEVPELLVLEAHAVSPAYAAWLEQAVRPGGSPP